MAPTRALLSTPRTALTRPLRSSQNKRCLPIQRRHISYNPLINSSGSINKITLTLGTFTALIGGIYVYGAATQTPTPIDERATQDREIDEWLSRLTPNVKQSMEAQKAKLVERFVRGADEATRSVEREAVEDAYRKEMYLIMTRQKKKGVGV